MKILRIIISGLAVAQVIATLQVHFSNTVYLDKLTALREAGYLTVPNASAMEALSRWGTAFFGGLFFTFTAGLALTLTALAAAWVSTRFFQGDRRFRIGMLMLWFGTAAWLNQDGFVPRASAYVLLIPPMVFRLSERLLPASGNGRPEKDILLQLGCILLLFVIGAGAGRIDTDIFTRIRDHLLMTHPLGRAVNDFYYHYTLYPAQVFKSPAQDLIRAAHLVDGPAEGSNGDAARIRTGRIKRTLTRLDYPVIESPETADLVVLQDGEFLRFIHRKETILSVSSRDFLKSPGDVLKSFSRGADRHAPFRRFTFISLMGVSALFVYGIFFLPARGIAALFATGFRASMLATALCLSAASGLFWMATFNPSPPLSPAVLQEELNREDPNARVAALRRIHDLKMDIASFEVHRKMARSPHVTERYWLARALEYSRSPETYDTHLTLLDDSQINVAYMAFLALGRRGEPRAVDEILRRLKTEDRWYVQMYAYKALRRLGWRQTESG